MPSELQIVKIVLAVSGATTAAYMCRKLNRIHLTLSRKDNNVHSYDSKVFCEPPATLKSISAPRMFMQIVLSSPF